LSGEGKYYAVNVPLKDGMTDAAYESLFKPVMARILEVYRPEAIVFQCGEGPRPSGRRPRRCSWKRLMGSPMGAGDRTGIKRLVKRKLGPLWPSDSSACRF
jgi:Histone deacetylase domain